MLNELAKKVHETARSKGFWKHEILGTIPAVQYHVPSADPRDGPQDVINPSIDSEKIALMHSKLSEALAGLRAGDLDNVAEEMADTIIRILDYCAWKGLDIDEAVRLKMEVNVGRPHLHGKVF